MRNLVLLINNYWKQQTDTYKTLILFFYWLKTVTPCSKFCINITHLNKSEALITVMSESFFREGFSLGHVIITTIIILSVPQMSSRQITLKYKLTRLTCWCINRLWLSKFTEHIFVWERCFIFWDKNPVVRAHLPEEHLEYMTMLNKTLLSYKIR